MLKRALFCVCLVGAFLLSSSLQAAVQKEVRVSPLEINWNGKDRKFEALFSVTNETSQDLELSCIIRFRNDYRRHWRGTVLPKLSASSTEQYKVILPAGMLLKHNYHDIRVILYKKKFQTYLDNSSRYVRLKSKRTLVGNQFQVQLTRSDPSKTRAQGRSPQQETFVLGDKALYRTELATRSAMRVKLKARLVIKSPTPSKISSIATTQSKPQAAEQEQIPEEDQWVSIDPRQAKKTTIHQAIETKQVTRLMAKVIGITTPEAKESGLALPDIDADPRAQLEISGEVEGKDIKAEPGILELEIAKVEKTPLRPVTLKLNKAADGVIELSWDSDYDTKQFAVYWSENQGVTKDNSTKIDVDGDRFTHKERVNGKRYYYSVSAIVGEEESDLSNEIEAFPQSTAVVETPIEVLTAGIFVEDFQRIVPIQALTVDIDDKQIAREENLKRAKALKTMDIKSREALISLYIAEGKSEGIAELLSDQLDKDPENLNLSLSLSKVYHEQGDTAAALNVLTTSLNRISLSARLALNQELKTSVKEGETTIKSETEEAFLANEFLKLGQSLLEKEKYRDALDAFQSLYSFAQNYPFLQFYMGESRSGLKQYNQAKRHYLRQAREKIDSGQKLTNLNSLSRVLAFSLELEDVDFAMDQYRRLMSEKPDKKSEIDQQLAALNPLLIKAQNRKYGNLPDLRIRLQEKFHLTNVQPEHGIIVKLAVENAGPQPSAEFKVYYTLKHESGAFYELEESERFKGIKGNATVHQWDKEIKIPKKAVKGNYQLVVSVEQDQGVDEITFKNNILTTDPAIEVISPISELALTFREPPEQLPIDRQAGVLMDMVVTNNGGRPSPRFKIEYTLEDKEGNHLRTIDEDYYPKLDKWERLVVKKRQIDVPFEFDEGNYNLTARLILEEEKKEIIKTNNTIASGYQLVIPDRFFGRYEEGVTYYSDKAKKEPDNLTHRLEVARYHRLLDDTDASLSVLTKTSTYISDKRQAQSSFFGKKVHFEGKALQKLVRDLRQMAEVFRSENDHFSALTSYQAIQMVDADFPLINRLIGNCRMGLGQYSLSKKEFLLQAEKTPDLKSLSDVKTILSYGSDLEAMVKTRQGFLKLSQNQNADDPEAIKAQISELDKMIGKAQQQMTREGSDLVIRIENPPALVAIKPRDLLEMEFSLDNLGKADSNPVTVHYQFISEGGNVFDTDSKTGFDRLDPDKKAVYWDEELRVPENIVGGAYQIRAVLEFQKNQADKDELNNQVATDLLFVYSEPDIVITDFNHRIKQILETGTTIVTQLAWENQGGNVANRNQLQIFLENVDNPEETIALKDEALSDLPAISETFVKSHELQIPELSPDKSYKLVARIKSNGDLKENSIRNNRFESSVLIGRIMEPVVVTGLNLNTDILYPEKTIDLELRLRNNDLQQVIKEVTVGLNLVNQKGQICCETTTKILAIPPSSSIKDPQGTIEVEDYLHKSSLIFPDVKQGKYHVQAKVLSTETISRIDSAKVYKSSTALIYGEPLFKVLNFYPIRDILIPGKENFFSFTVANNGKNRSNPEVIELFLETKELIPIGKVSIGALPPSDQNVTLGKFLKLPETLQTGTYSLVLRKPKTDQGSAQTLRYRSAVKVHQIQSLTPQEFESFKQNEVPLFVWNSVDDLSFRLAFSNDPSFENTASVFRIPGDSWLEENEYKPQAGEWNIIWLLSQNSKQNLYWRVEAMSAQKKLIMGIPQKISLKSERVN